MCIPTGAEQKQASSSASSSTVNIAEKKMEANNAGPSSAVYSWTEPDASLCMKDHFSSLLFGGSVANTVLEVVLLAAPFTALAIYGNDNDTLNVKGSMPLMELAVFFVVCSIVRRFYNAYLEAVYFSFPKLRTQPPHEHRLKMKKDLMGRDQEQVELLDKHDKVTMISQFVLNFGMYFILPGFYPTADADADADTQPQSLQERFIRLILNHYLMSFGMYWAHRSLHVVPYLWQHIHSIHHWAKHPLSRNTYEDHWFDNFANAIIGHLYAQILIPLDRPTFWFSRIFRIFESLEKHSGVSCGFNLAYTAQQWLPFAQMPHHHDWHHEGFKGSNYTFTSIGGLWDCVFGTRKGGRYKANEFAAATREDMAKSQKVTELPSWFSPLSPLVGLTVVVAMRLNGYC
jgi:sterol desaturase/sphingolipid hydroxylase (fatty acid hydroxylase superfamily)